MAAVARAALPRLARALATPARSHARAMSSVVELSSYLEKYCAASLQNLARERNVSRIQRTD